MKYTKKCLSCDNQVDRYSKTGYCKSCYWTTDVIHEHIRKLNSNKLIEKLPNAKRTKFDWERQAAPIMCFWCGMNFEEYEERVVTENDDGGREDYHIDCHSEAMN